jgi:hypothetical protein
MANASSTPWGAASVVDEVRVQQRAGERRFASVVQLLESGGERGPVTLRMRDLERLHAELAKHPELAAALGLSGGA